ncbi:DUF2520 domain-containing protein [Saxibacter everestensis]|uniref:DUF2520 domain-containing protein n=1 Tax=Saxibacter everestensis TaxID=2909229 RepID=A0ABY8QPU5_9MICO|nr:DUF2520 domain-containing protein [Brevibacteriaceae bacterium ZFBP1038]
MSSATSRPGRLGVGIVGAGRVGAVIGNALRAAGHAVVGATATSDASVERVENLLPGVPILDIPTVIERSELVLLTVPDDALPELVEGLATAGCWQQGQLVAHCAGRYGVEVLRPVLGFGAIPLAIHPVMSFTGTSIDVARLSQAVFGVTAAAPVLPVAQALVVEMGAEPIVIAEADRPAYHAAVAHASNHTVTVIAQASEMLEAIGIEDPGQVLAALVRASADNALEKGQAALTGPVSRGDVETVRAHLEALTEHARATGNEELLITYALMSRATTERALAAGMIGQETGRKLLGILGSVPGR